MYLWPLRLIAVVAGASLSGIAVANAAIIQNNPDGLSVSIVPTISLIAVIGAALTVGAMFQRVRGLEGQVNDLKDDVKELREARAWDGTHERRHG